MDHIIFLGTASDVKLNCVSFHRLGKVLTNPTSHRGPIYKLYNEVKELLTKTTNNPMKNWGTELNKEFQLEESKKDEKHLRKCTTHLAISKMQRKTIRYTLLVLTEWLKLGNNIMIVFIKESFH